MVRVIAAPVCKYRGPNKKPKPKGIPKIKQQFHKPTAEDLTKCRYVPFTTIEKVLNYVKQPVEENVHNKNYSYCKSHLAFLQSERCGIQYKSGLEVRSWKTMYYLAINDALYKHDWNKVAYMMAKTPFSEHYNSYRDYGNYPKLLAILLLFHPYAKSNKLMENYLHMVLSCYSNEEKMAAMKILNTLPAKLLKPRKKN